MNRSLAFVTSAAAVAALAAPAAAAPSLSLDAPCYYAGSTISATGNGFPPNAPVQISDPDTGSFSASVTADPVGTLLTNFTAPSLSNAKPAVVKFTATATDTADATQTASATFYDVQPGVDANVNGSLTTPVVWTIAGFGGGRVVYGHWVFKHKDRKTLKMGTVPGQCGLVKRKVKRLPVTPRVGVWTAQFDLKKKWNATTKPRVFLKIDVFRQ